MADDGWVVSVDGKTVHVQGLADTHTDHVSPEAVDRYKGLLIERSRVHLCSFGSQANIRGGREEGRKEGRKEEK